MTGDEHRRLTKALTRKSLRVPRAGYHSDEQWLEVIIGTVIADVDLVHDGVLSIDDYETALNQ